MTYSSLIIGRAKEHQRAGWEPYEIRDLLAREFGQAPALETVKSWLDPVFAARRRAATAGSKARYQVRAGRRVRHTTPEWRLERMRELHGVGLSALAISQVARVWWGEEIAEGTVRDRLGGSARRSYRKRVVGGLS